MHKYNQNGLNPAGTNFLAGADTPNVHVRVSTLCCFPHLSTQTFANLRRGSGEWKPGKGVAGSGGRGGGDGGGLTRETYRGDIFRLMHGDEVCAFNGVTREPGQSLEPGEAWSLTHV